VFSSCADALVGPSGSLRICFSFRFVSFRFVSYGLNMWLWVPTHPQPMPVSFPVPCQGQDLGWCSSVSLIIEMMPCPHLGPCLAGALTGSWQRPTWVLLCWFLPPLPENDVRSGAFTVWRWQQTELVMHARSSPPSGCSLWELLELPV